MEDQLGKRRTRRLNQGESLALSRLRWQLTLSHLIAIAVTLVSMIAALLLITSAWWNQASNPSLEAADDARVVATGIQPLVNRNLEQPADSTQGAELSRVLDQIASGDVRLLSAPPWGPPAAAGAHAPLNSSLKNLAYLVVVGPNGRVFGSSDPSGPTFVPREQPEWSSLVKAALGGTTDSTRLVVVRTGDGPVALGAYPIVNPNGQPDRRRHCRQNIACSTERLISVLADAPCLWRGEPRGAGRIVRVCPELV